MSGLFPRPGCSYMPVVRTASSMDMPWSEGNHIRDGRGLVYIAPARFTISCWSLSWAPSFSLRLPLPYRLGEWQRLPLCPLSGERWPNPNFSPSGKDIQEEKG